MTPEIVRGFHAARRADDTGRVGRMGDEHGMERVFERFEGEGAALERLLPWLLVNVRARRELVERALPALRSDAERLGYARSLAWLDYYAGWIEHDTGNYEAAIRSHEACARAFGEFGESGAFARCCNGLAASYKYMGDGETAGEWVRRGLEAARASGDRTIEASLHVNHSGVLVALGRHEEGADACELALAIPEIGSQAAILARTSLAGYRTRGGHPGEALALAREARELAEKDGFKVFESAIGVAEGNALMAMGRMPEALASFEKAIANAEACDDPLSLADAELECAKALEAAGDARAALERFDDSRERAASIGARFQESDATRGAARCAAALGDWRTAYGRLERASEIDRGIFDARLERSIAALSRERASRELELERGLGERVRAMVEIGREITATLDPGDVIDKIYDSVNRLVPADVFGIAEYDARSRRFRFRAFIDRGTRMDGGEFSIDDPDSFGAWALRNGREVMVNDVDAEFSSYVRKSVLIGRQYDGTNALVYVPLFSRGAPAGLITVQTYAKCSYERRHVETLLALAPYAAVALANATLYEEAKLARERAEEADKVKSRFLANMSHELRTPLNAIINFAYLVGQGHEGPMPETAAEMVRRIEDSGRHLLELINNVLDLSKIEAGKMELSFERVELRPLVDGVISAASALVKGKRLALGRDLPEEPTAVMADRTRVRQVLLNLVSNAVKFTDSGGVTVSVRRADGRIEVAVSDTGIGMRPDEVERAFDEFEQLEGKHRNKPGGTGLGLPISRQLVRMHGGELEAESAPGKGSTFRFSLPEWKDPA